MRKTDQVEKRFPLASCVDCGMVCIVGGPAKDKRLRDIPPDWRNAAYAILGPEVGLRQGFGPRDDGGQHLCPLQTMNRVPDHLYEDVTMTIDPDAWDDV